MPSFSSGRNFIGLGFPLLRSRNNIPPHFERDGHRHNVPFKIHLESSPSAFCLRYCEMPWRQCLSLYILRPTLDGSGVQIPRNQFGLIWSKLNPLSWILALHLDSSYHELSFLSSFFGFEPIDFPSKMVPCKLSLNLPLFGFGPSSKIALRWIEDLLSDLIEKSHVHLTSSTKIQRILTSLPNLFGD